MLSEKSIRIKFLLQLVLASSTLIVIFSAILYQYIKFSFFQNELNFLTSQAKMIKTAKFNKNLEINLHIFDKSGGIIRVNIIENIFLNKLTNFKNYTSNGKHYLTLYYPYDNKNKFISLSKEITNISEILNQILLNIFIVNFSAIFLILFYALFLSRMLLVPIKTLNYRLSKLNEKLLEPVEPSNLPEEFVPLANSINRLISRIQTFVKCQKELFIGAAHELKTPLAVMKTKNEVTLLKKRENERYMQALKDNNTSIDEMNSMISSILEVGRQEGAQFEKPKILDLVSFFSKKANDFSILAKQKEIKIQIDIKPKNYEIVIQATLLLHIVQNFVQNAIKFSSKDSTIEIKTYASKKGFFLEVIDEGVGIDESKDLFAPFKRYGNQSGAGLGLFLAKNAADAIGAQISLKNRIDKPGTIASLFISNEVKSKNDKNL